ncbi:MAG: hypothetical protein K0R18_2564 [Bacillales bacterium]|nr:hypothetical protein [Bacillales bacterium]
MRETKASRTHGLYWGRFLLIVNSHQSKRTVPQRVNNTREERENIELKYAIDNKAIYWNAWGKQRKEAKIIIRRITINLSLMEL